MPNGTIDRPTPGAGESALLKLLNRAPDDPDLVAAIVAPLPEMPDPTPALAARIASAGPFRTIEDLAGTPAVGDLAMNRLRTLAASGVFATLDNPLLLQDGDPPAGDAPKDPPDGDGPGATGTKTADAPSLKTAIELDAALAGCTRLLSITATPNRLVRDTVQLRDLEQFDLAILAILRGFALGLETFIRKSQLLVGATEQGMEREFQKVNDGVKGTLGRDLNAMPVAPDPAKDFQRTPDGKLDRNSIPGFPEMDKAVDDLRKLEGRPSVAREGRDSLLNRRVDIVIEFTRPQPNDIGRPVVFTQIERIDSRINTPLTRVPRIADIVIDGQTVPSQVIRRPPFDTTAEIFPRFAVGNLTVPLPESGRLTGSATLLGNYGSTRLAGWYVCPNGTQSIAVAQIDVSGLTEQQVRAAEDVRNQRVLSDIQRTGDRVTTVRNAVTVVNALIDTLGTFGSFLAKIPGFTMLIGSILEAFSNIIENLLQGLEAALETLTILRLEEWRLRNFQVRNLNLGIAESYPEDGIPGQTETIMPLAFVKLPPVKGK